MQAQLTFASSTCSGAGSPYLSHLLRENESASEKIFRNISYGKLVIGGRFEFDSIFLRAVPYLVWVSTGSGRQLAVYLLRATNLSQLTGELRMRFELQKRSRVVSYLSAWACRIRSVIVRGMARGTSASLENIITWQQKQRRRPSLFMKLQGTVSNRAKALGRFLP